MKGQEKRAVQLHGVHKGPKPPDLTSNQNAQRTAREQLPTKNVARKATKGTLPDLGDLASPLT
jgi:hypothetical protein